MLAYCNIVSLSWRGMKWGCGMIFCGGVLLRRWRREVVHGAGILRCSGLPPVHPFRPGIIIHGDPVWDINREMAAWPGAIRPAQRIPIALVKINRKKNQKRCRRGRGGDRVTTLSLQLLPLGLPILSLVLFRPTWKSQSPRPVKVLRAGLLWWIMIYNWSVEQGK